jgi:hypothetical protein
MKINLNDLAKEITLQEGKKRSLPIGQVKEVLKITLLKLKQFTTEDVIKLLRRIK